MQSPMRGRNRPSSPRSSKNFWFAPLPTLPMSQSILTVVASSVLINVQRPSAGTEGYRQCAAEGREARGRRRSLQRSTCGSRGR